MLSERVTYTTDGIGCFLLPNGTSGYFFRVGGPGGGGGGGVTSLQLHSCVSTDKGGGYVVIDIAQVLMVFCFFYSL